MEEVLKVFRERLDKLYPSLSEQERANRLALAYDIKRIYEEKLKRHPASTSEALCLAGHF